jgi:hypothetical protein
MTKRLAAFGAGVALWEAIVHGSLLISRQRPTLFGIQLTDRLNVVQSLVPAAVALLLGRYAFSTALSRIPARQETPAGEI